MNTLLDAALAATRQLWMNHQALIDFAPFPAQLEFQHIPENVIPAAGLVRSWQNPSPLHSALAAAAPCVNWQQTYTEAEVGADFLARYGWFELIGPTGHFVSETCRAYIAFWGANLVYDWHLHEAEELYYCISGNALFRAEGLTDVLLTPGQTRFHTANQLHAMTTLDDPILTLVLWRGPGLVDTPRMWQRSMIPSVINDN